MLNVVNIGSASELRAAQALAALVRAEWRGIDGSPDEIVTIGSGVRLNVEIDLLVTIELQKPRLMPFGQVQAGVLVIEVKDLDASRFRATDNDLRPIYGNAPSARTVLEQVADQELAVRSWYKPYSVERPFVHDLVWIRGATRDELPTMLSPKILGSDAGWADMLRAADTGGSAIAYPCDANYLAGVALLRKRLLSERKLTARDRATTDHLTTDAVRKSVLEPLLEKAGKAQVRITGRAGSGKSTTLALLGIELARQNGDRILFLTYNRVLRGELEHLVRRLAEGTGLPPTSLVVRSRDEFVVQCLEYLGAVVPYEKGQPVYVRIQETIDLLVAGRGRESVLSDAATLKEIEPELFGFDYLFIDEAHDWPDSRRDFVRLFFPPTRTVLADGVDQFAEQQGLCNWNAGVDSAQRWGRELKTSLRMSHNVAQFVNAVAKAAGAQTWEIKASGELAGGRVLLYSGGDSRNRCIAETIDKVREAGEDLADCLIVAPPRTSLASVVAACGVDVWDATDASVRDIPRQPDEVRIVAYRSTRGVEGWATALIGLDRHYDNRKEHYDSGGVADMSPEAVARGALLLALTRAAHVLAIQVDDPNHVVARWLRDAAAECGADIVEVFNA